MIKRCEIMKEEYIDILSKEKSLPIPPRIGIIGLKNSTVIPKKQKAMRFWIF